MFFVGFRYDKHTVPRTDPPVRILQVQVKTVVQMSSQIHFVFTKKLLHLVRGEWLTEHYT